MKYLDLTLRTPAENVACDEALLDYCDATRECGVLRFWEPKEHFVVVGYSNKVPLEVNVDACRKNGVVILRRCSGGGTVLQGPGCLNYSLVLRIDSDPALQTVTGTNRFVMERNRAALASLITPNRNDLNEPSPKSSIQHPASSIQHPASSIQHPASSLQHPASSISVQGHTDLTLASRKFSGNAQRRRRHAVLFHGTFLLSLDFRLMDKLLLMPSKQPDYRQNREHAEFLINLELTAAQVKEALRRAWTATGKLREVPTEAIQTLVAKKYSTLEWNFK